MSISIIQDVRQYVSGNIGKFHDAKLANLRKLRLRKVMAHKNPYLFRAKNMEKASDIVRSIVDAFLSSSEESIFGDWLEELSIHVCQRVYGGFKSSAKGIDLEFDDDGIRYLVSIKSGPNWGNSSQIRKMREDFKSARRTLLTSNSRLNIRAVNGCCYGRTREPNKGEYLKLCGQEFWKLISGEDDLYLDIIEPLATEAESKNEAYRVNYNKMLNVFEKEFLTDFCLPDGQIDWQGLVRFNSGRYAQENFHREDEA